jgi:DNA polymerase II large subunit
MATVEDDVEAFLIDRKTERTRRYVHEGRRFKSVTDDDLRAKWIAAFKERSANPLHPELGKRSEDLQAEMEIRKIEPPSDEVKAEAEAFIAHVRRGMEHLNAEELEADIDAVKAKRDSSAKN